MELKNKILFSFLYFSLVLFFSCSKTDNITPNVDNDIRTSNNQMSVYAFTVGNYDSATYYFYQPSYDLTYTQNFPGYYSDTDSFDLDLDGANDIALHIEGFADNFVSGNTNYFQLNLYNVANLEFVCGVNNKLDTLNLGDMLSNSLNWINTTNYLLWYSSPLNNDGNWGIGYNTKYVGFRKTNNDTLMGWFSLSQVNQTGVALRITDCAIENP